MEARSKPIQDWFSMIRNGELTLPRFQRFEAWRPAQIEGVFENILREPSLPIGALLVLEVGDEELFISRPISGAPAAKERPNLNLLDGQQRMTALWRALHDDYEAFRALVRIEETSKPDVEILRTYLHSKTGNLMPRWVEDPKEVLARGFFPLSILCPGAEGERRFSEWIKEAELGPSEMMRLGALRNKLATYTVPFLSLPVTTEQETALDVFINMNTSASPLREFDIVVAQLEGAVGQSLHDMIEDLLNEVPDAASFGRMQEVVLSVGALLMGKPPLKKSFLEASFGHELSRVWPDVVRGISRAVAFLRDEAIFNDALLPTEVLVYLTAALWAKVPQDGADVEGHARTIIRKTIWRASFTDRYLKTAATRAYQDHRAISALIAGQPAANPPPLFDEIENPLPTADELLRAGWPTRKDRLGRAVLAVSLYTGGFDFADGQKATADNVTAREFHHLYPKALLLNDYPEQRINLALNCALISWKTNRKIAAKTPADYIAKRSEDANATPAQVKQRLKSHLVPYKSLISGDYQRFLKKRAEKVHAAMLTLCAGDHL